VPAIDATNAVYSSAEDSSANEASDDIEDAGEPTMSVPKKAKRVSGTSEPRLKGNELLVETFRKGMESIASALGSRSSKASDVSEMANSIRETNKV
jgi:hypothetical protein